MNIPVFGELLYCLEYRGEVGEITLPTFGGQETDDGNPYKFYIPENVYIIGTMNDVDKSLQVFDRALRRRFYFYHHKTDLDVVLNVLTQKENKENSIFDNDSVKDYIGQCKKLNKDIKEKLNLDEAYQIGHAYFLKIRDFYKHANAKDIPYSITAVELEKLWDYSLLPLLEDYLGNKLKGNKGNLSKMKADFTGLKSAQ